MRRRTGLHGGALAATAEAPRGIFVGVLFLGDYGVLLVVLTIVIGVIIAAAGRTAGQSQQHRGRDPDEHHASESEADRDAEGGQRQPDAKLKPIFDHVCLVLQTKRRRARVLGRNGPGD